MPIITLPDGSKREFSGTVTAAEVAASIGPGLAKSALAAKVENQLLDLSTPLSQDCTLVLLTSKDPEALEIIRHSTAHLLAQAVKQLFPTTQVTIGPVIEDGFYYDFAFERPFTPEDLLQIEERMQALAKAATAVERFVLSRDKAIAFFQERGEHYKAEIIASIPASETLSLYTQGDFTDLCRGPHVPHTGHLRVFKLTKVSGAYWRGDSKNAMLQRIYGTAWVDKKDLEAYLHRQEEAQKRDHRRLGKVLNLFHLQEEAPGMVFWHPHGWTIYSLIKDYIRNKIKRHGYLEVNTPQVVSRTLWEQSGHWEKFHKEMFTTQDEHRDFAIKPMNCPCHVQIFKQGIKSYRDLPLRLAEFGSCHRNEPSGALHGLLRVRGFTQDDAHIFCTEDQIQAEVASFIQLLFEIYADFGFTEITMKLSTRPEQRLGGEALWDKAEQALAQALDNAGVTWALQPGEGAFYGPKIEFSLTDCLNRVWQCGTVQVDFSIPARLEATYIAEDNTRQTPVMVHRAILGSFERFIGILIEQYAGNFPAWLAPIQASILNITEHQADYAQKIVQNLENNGFRVICDLRNEKIGFKIREHTLQKVPYLIVVGGRERDTHTIAVRTQSGEDLGVMSLEAFADRLKQAVAQCSRVDPVL